MQGSLSYEAGNDSSSGRPAAPGSVAILVSSCDAYSDLWTPFAKSLRQFWPDCPWPRYLLTNFKQAPEGFETVAVGEDSTWSRNLIVALERIPSKYVLLTVDDLILRLSVDTRAVEADARWAAEHQVAALQMAKHEPLWSLFWRFTRSTPLYMAAGSTYRASTVFTLWNRVYLLRLLDAAENAWQFEYRASERIADSEQICMTSRRRFLFVNSVIKGRLTLTAVRFFTRNGYEISPARKVMTVADQRAYNRLYMRNWLFKLVPPMLRRRLKRCMQ